MTKSETFAYCTESFKNFILSFYEKFENNPEDKFQFEFMVTVAARAESKEQSDINEFSLYLTKCIVHYGDELISELRKVYEQVIPADRRLEWN